MQLLVIFDASGYDAFKSAHDDGEENRSHAGISTMQIWKEAGGSRVLALYRVSDKGKAEAYLSGEMELVTKAAGVSGSQHYFLETA
ncbi:hypothetical protein ACMA5I_08835 [Paracoccaceae bacterium GXU_MW_L88]